jgi:hypothetical protein
MAIGLTIKNTNVKDMLCNVFNHYRLKIKTMGIIIFLMLDGYEIALE